MKGLVAALLAAALGAGGVSGAPQEALSGIERRIVARVDEQAAAAVALLAETVDINSGTHNVEGVRAVAEVYAGRLRPLGFQVRTLEQPPQTARGPHLVAERAGSSGRRLLLIGHLDTVFERDHPFQRWERLDGSARGPGAVDMKGGNAVLIQALEALHGAGALEGASLTVFFTGDEEDPGPLEISRRDLVAAAGRSDVALGFEGAVALDSATVGRRGASEWTLRVKGKPAHSSGIFRPETGAGAAFEAARTKRAALLIHRLTRGEGARGGRSRQEGGGRE